MNIKKYLLFIVINILIIPTILLADTKCMSLYGNSENVISVATGSLGRLGLLKALSKPFTSKYNVSICYVYAGSGKALELLHQKQVDLVLVHSAKAELNAVKEGWATNRKLVCSNEFYIVGPKDDPAGIKKAKDAVEAYRLIAEKKAKFLSRGDQSGTHMKELEIWEKTGITDKGKWYIVTNANMTETLKRANKLKGYFMPENTTWITSKDKYPSLDLLFKGDKSLLNVYHALMMNYDNSEYNKYAKKFLEFMTSEGGQEIIRNFGKKEYGQPLFNDAERTKELIDSNL